MGDELSYEEDFSEMIMFPSQEIELPKKKTKEEESPFEILSMDKIVHDVFDMISKVKSFLEVNIS